MDPAKMKVVDLRSELGALGLDTKGNKPALVERLKKALESKSGKAIPDTSILDTSTEDLDDSPSTPRRAGPAARTRRRSSSSRIAATPAKAPRIEDPEPVIEEEPEKKLPAAAESSPETERDSSPVRSPLPVEAPSPVKTPSPVKAKSPAKAASPVKTPQKKAPEQYEPELPTVDDDVQCINDERSQSPIPVDDDKEEKPQQMETAEDGQGDKPPEDAQGDKPAETVVLVPKQEVMEVEDGEPKSEAAKEKEAKERELRRRDRVLTEEEEWEQLNERLKVKEKERLERERLQAEEDAKKLEEVSNDPVKLQRLQRKREKKQRWSNFYQSVAITNEVLTPPAEEPPAPPPTKGKKEDASALKIPEPELDDDKVTLSWYDNDLNQYLELPELNSVVPLSDGAFAHAWAGVRATHGVTSGRVCYEVRVGALVSTTETAILTAATDTPATTSGLRIGWSTDNSSLHLGEGESSWGFESSARAVHNGEFKEYGRKLEEKDVVGAYVDLESTPCKISYTINGEELGVAHEFDKDALAGRAIFPHILTRNMCYKVNFGHDRYNFLTKTKIVRKRVEIPIDKILEEKRVKEERLQKLKEEAAKREQEKKEKDKKDREERLRKKREDRERKQREEAERKKAEAESKQDGDKEANGEPKENGEKQEAESQGAETAPAEEKMETDEQPPPPPVPAPAPAQPLTDTDAAKQDAEPAVAEGPVPEVTEEQVYGGLVLDKRIKFVIRFTVDEELDGEEASLLPGYMLIAHGQLVAGPRRPATRADCEVILMVGMPGAGKTHWARQHAASHPDKRYNIISTGALFDRMKVDCKPFRSTYEGRWDAMVSKTAKCVLKLLEFAQGRRRNFILDQTNVYPSAQRRKLREFDGYKRIAVVVIPDEATYLERQKKREEADGKEVPDGAIMDMKANFSLPEKGTWLDEVIFAELDEEESKKVIEGFHKEAKAAGVVREREKRERSQSRDGPPPAKRQKSGDRRHGGGREDRRGGRDFGARGDREDRWMGGGGGGGAGGGRWGPAGGRDARGGGRDGGGRWGPPSRDRGAPGAGERPGGARFNDRWSRGGGAGEFGGGRGGGRGGGEFRGGRGGGGRERGGRGGDRPAGGPPPMDQGRFSRDNRPGAAGAGGGGGGGGGAGSWQRGGQLQNARGGPPGGGRPQGQRGGAAGPPGNKQDGGGQNAQNQQQWNQWGWQNWQNWNQQNQANWGQWGNWANWNAQNAAGQQAGGGAAAGAGKGGQAAAGGAAAAGGQWPANYTAQQWYQWQQWQQQQQGWPGYGQGQQGAAAATTPEQQQQMWAQYYQNYGQNAANASNAAATIDKK